MGLLFAASVAGIATIASYFNPEIRPKITIPDITDEIIHLTNVVFPETIKTVLPELRTKSVEAPIVNNQLVNPIIVHSDEAVQDVASTIEIKNTTTAVSDGLGTIGINPTSQSGTGTVIKTTDTGNIIITAVALYKLPEFPGGINKFYTYVGNNFEKQEIDGTSTIKVYVSFVIEKDGSMTDIQVKKDPGYCLDQEAVRVLKSLKTKWSPGLIGSKPVRTSYNLPILVQMD